jgi:hypothetical protein
MYVNTEALAQPEVEAFVQYVLDNAESLATDALFVPLTSEQKQKALSDLDAASSGT